MNEKEEEAEEDRFFTLYTDKTKNVCLFLITFIC